MELLSLRKPPFSTKTSSSLLGIGTAPAGVGGGCEFGGGEELGSRENGDTSEFSWSDGSVAMRSIGCTPIRESLSSNGALKIERERERT